MEIGKHQNANSGYFESGRGLSLVDVTKLSSKEAVPFYTLTKNV